MVYDTSNNFIGDLHWQAIADLEDGDELELERAAVLVQVGERLERTETDLAPLLEKKRTAPAIRATQIVAGMSPVSQRTVTTPPSSRFSVASSSAVQYPADRLKSLNEVLGINRAPIGKAVIPTKSPFEQRQENRTVSAETSRPSKRPRRTSRDEDIVEQREQFVLPSARENSTAASRRRKRSPREDDVVEQREQSIRPLTRKTSISKTSTRTTSTLAVTEPDPTPALSFQPASALNISSASGSFRAHRNPSIKEPSGRQKSITDSFTVDSSTNIPRFPTQKPRNKLMCMELLSGKKAKQKDQVGAQIIQGRPSSSSTNILAPVPESPSDDSNANSVAENSALNPAYIPSASTMQALEEAATIPPPSSQRDAMISDFFRPNIPTPLPPEPRVNQNVPENAPRTLNRSHSDTTSLLPPVVANTAITDILPPETCPRPQPRSLGRSLQKSVSDVSSLRASNARPAASRGIQTRLVPMMTAGDSLSASFEGEDEEQGPWTCEAFDLFEFWPPGRPKPISKPAV